MDYKDPYIFTVRTISYPRGLLSVIERRELWPCGYMAAQWIAPNMGTPLTSSHQCEAIMAIHGETEVCIGSTVSRKLTPAGQALIVPPAQSYYLKSGDGDGYNALALVVSGKRLKSDVGHKALDHGGTLDDCKIIDLPTFSRVQ